MAKVRALASERLEDTDGRLGVDVERAVVLEITELPGRGVVDRKRWGPLKVPPSGEGSNWVPATSSALRKIKTPHSVHTQSAFHLAFGPRGSTVSGRQTELTIAMKVAGVSDDVTVVSFTV